MLASWGENARGADAEGGSIWKIWSCGVVGDCIGDCDRARCWVLIIGRRRRADLGGSLFDGCGGGGGWYDIGGK